jgi:hypothetical protein
MQRQVVAFVLAGGRGGFVAKFGAGLLGKESMPITATNPFKGRQYPGEVILQAVRWYLRYPLAYEHVRRAAGRTGLEVELRDLIARFASRDGDHPTAIDSLCLIRYSSSLTPRFGVLAR